MDEVLGYVPLIQPLNCDIRHVSPFLGASTLGQQCRKTRSERPIIRSEGESNPLGRLLKETSQRRLSSYASAHAYGESNFNKKKEFVYLFLLAIFGGHHAKHPSAFTIPRLLTRSQMMTRFVDVFVSATTKSRGERAGG